MSRTQGATNHSFGVLFTAIVVSMDPNAEGTLTVVAEVTKGWPHELRMSMPPDVARFLKVGMLIEVDMKEK